MRCFQVNNLQKQLLIRDLYQHLHFRAGVTIKDKKVFQNNHKMSDEEFDILQAELSYSYATSAQYMLNHDVLVDEALEVFCNR